MAEITHAKALRAIAATREFHEIASKFAPPAPRRRPTVKAKPTLALAKKKAQAKGYFVDAAGVMGYWSFSLYYGDEWAGDIYAHTRTAALAGLVAVIDALPKRKGKR